MAYSTSKPKKITTIKLNMLGAGRSMEEEVNAQQQRASTDTMLKSSRW